MKTATTLYTRLHRIDLSVFTDNLAEAIINFSTERNTTFPDWNITLDMNQFMLSGNIYEENFPGQNSPILYFQNLRRVLMMNETFNYNNGHYQEALERFGTILPKTNAAMDKRGAIPFSEYYKDSGYFSSTQRTEKGSLYPNSPLLFDGVVDIRIAQISFDSNFKQEIANSDLSSYNQQAQ